MKIVNLEKPEENLGFHFQKKVLQRVYIVLYCSQIPVYQNEATGATLYRMPSDKAEGRRSG